LIFRPAEVMEILGWGINRVGWNLIYKKKNSQFDQIIYLYIFEIRIFQINNKNQEMSYCSRKISYSRNLFNIDILNEIIILFGIDER
jgi:hypothetical protein